MKKLLLTLSLTLFITACGRQTIDLTLYNKMGNYCKSNGGIDRFEFFHTGYMHVYCKDTAHFELIK